MATYPAETPTSSGLTPTVRSAAASDRVPPGSTIRVTNGNASTCNVGLVLAGTVDGNTITTKTIAIPTTQVRYILVPSYPPQYTDPTDGQVQVTFSVTATVTYEVVNVP